MLFSDSRMPLRCYARSFGKARKFRRARRRRQPAMHRGNFGAPIEVLETRTLLTTLFSDIFPSTTFDATKWTTVEDATIDNVGIKVAKSATGQDLTEKCW